METIGLIPAGGKATRLHPLPFSKELMPVGLRDTGDGRKTVKVVSHYLLDKYRRANCLKTYFILHKGKWDIPAYFGDGSSLGIDLAYLIMNLPYGVPYTLDQAYPFIRHSKVFLGFPDVLFDPEDAYVQLDLALEGKGADILLGLFATQNAIQTRKSDMVEWEKDGRIRRILVKPQSCHLQYGWIIAVWTPVFSRYMHEFLKQDRMKRARSSSLPELHVGHVIQQAIEDGLKVYGHAFPGCSYLDVGTTDELVQAQRKHLDLIAG